MTRLIGAELYKLRTTRTFYGMVGGALALVLVIAILAASLGKWEGSDDQPLGDIIGISGFAQVFALLLGILAVTSEFRHGTVTPSLLVVPDRVKLTLAKLGASLIAGFGLGLVATGLAVAIAAVIFNARGIDTGLSGDEVTKMLAGSVVAAGLYAGLGVGVGALIRNQVGAIVGTLVYLFVLENLLLLVPWVRDQVPKYGFGALGSALTGTAADDPAPLGQVPAGLLLAAYCAVFVAAGLVMMRRRDVTA